MANSTKTELARIGVPARLVTIKNMLTALGDVDAETMIRHHAGALIIEQPNPTLVDGAPTPGGS